MIAIQRQPGTNTIEVVNNVKALLPTFRAEIPASIQLATLYDRSVSIRDSISDVKFTLWLTLALVVLVIFIFLRNISATTIPSLALPMSIIGTFAVMYLLNYTIDNLSMMALVLSVGFVVDDAIVMLENIVRHMEMGEGVFEAALNGSREISFTILSMTLSLAAVFIPVLFMGGLLGRLLHEFSVTIMCAVMVSGIVSLTLTPMLCSRFLRPPKEQKHGHVYLLFERGFQLIQKRLRLELRGVLRHRLVTLLASFVIVVFTVQVVHSNSQGLSSQRRFGRHVRHHPGGTGHFLRCHEAAPDRGDENHHRRSQCLRRDVFRRRGAAGLWRQLGLLLCPLEGPPFGKPGYGGFDPALVSPSRA